MDGAGGRDGEIEEQDWKFSSWVLQQLRHRLLH